MTGLAPIRRIAFAPLDAKRKGRDGDAASRFGNGKTPPRR